MAAPVGSKIREALEPVGNSVVDLLFLGVGLCVGLADALGYNISVTFRVASVLAVLALHARRVLEEVGTEGATHDVVELS